ncbi:MAG TPA: NAD(P)/FAD-dependent oxidoreductase, partial [Candidatus Sumerlaeota bacterium]|nr:NAD(P)/FAD-dependent oxidoreductase [Candidatus Sumerlaeota bacterium]
MSSGEKKTVAVIGAGLGGISAAISLAAHGYRVRVYEKNAHVGGKLNQLVKEGFSFDLGPSILTLPKIFERLFDIHNRKMADYVSICSLEPQWRNFFEDGTTIDLFSSVEETLKANAALGPDDQTELSRFMEYSKKLYEKVLPGYFREGFDTVWTMTWHHGLISSLKDFDLFRSMHTAVCSHVHNPYLQTILCFFIKYVGSSPYDAPAVLNLLPYIQSRFGLWYVTGGMFHLAKALERLARDVGIEIHAGKEVVRILAEGKKVQALQTKDGEIVPADI